MRHREATPPGVTTPGFRYVFRVSHPPDVLLLPKPFHHLSGGNAHGVQALRRLPLPRHGFSPLGQASPPGVGSNGSAGFPLGRASLAFRAFPSVEVRCRPAHEATVRLDPPLSFSPLQGCISFDDGPGHPGRLLPWAWSRSAGKPPAYPALRSLDHRRPWELPRMLPPLLGLLHLVPSAGFPVRLSVPDRPFSDE